MEEEFRQAVIEKLRRKEELPREWARALFPPEKREYELVYYDKEREEDILAETMAVPLQPVCTFGRNGQGQWHNMLIFGDNLQALRTLIEQKKEGRLCNADGTPGVKLIYIDPPFATRQEFRGSDEQKAYQDKVAGAAFLEFLRKRLILMRELLSGDGSLVVHLDLRKCHYVKVILDEVFLENRLLNEIVWHYENKLGTGGDVFDGRHDTLFWYANGPRHQFKAIHEPVKERKQQPVTQKIDGERIWLRDENGDRRYALSKETRPVGDVWNIPIINPVASERLGYPTQKPEALAARVLAAASKPGDIIVDCFAGSGTVCAVAEKTGRRWIGIDCGKLSIYTIQKRLLNISTSKNLEDLKKPYNKDCLPFTLYNAGLYDFSSLKNLPWEDWRFFALKLFGCKDDPHTIGGLRLDGRLKGSSVLVFDHVKQAGKQIDEETIHDIHAAVGNKVGSKFFIIAPRGVFEFQQDYIDRDGVRYYALRIPYSVINELHRREFTALQQPNDEAAVNDIVDAWGFDFIRPPAVDWVAGLKRKNGQASGAAFLKIKKFKSHARLHGQETHGGLETFSMLMLDFDYGGDVFDLDAVFYAHQLEGSKWEAAFLSERIGDKVMAVFIDIHGNEARVVIPRSEFGLSSRRGRGKAIARKVVR